MLPLFETCRGADSYYATLAHETTHWTAHESRLARDFGTTRSGPKATQSKKSWRNSVLRSSVPTLI
jgi:antirestriction protein ArdC